MTNPMINQEALHPTDMGQAYNPVQEAQQILSNHNTFAGGESLVNPFDTGAQAAPEQGEQNAVGFNPMLLNLFMRAHGNEQMSKMFANLLVADVATKQIINYAEANRAHQDMLQQQAMDVMDPFGIKAKKEDEKRSSESRYAVAA